jgi:drug/metabolite transporter (DMT)-like permease
LRGFLALILASFFWGTSPPATEFALRNFSPQVIIFLRFFLSSALLFVLLRKKPVLSKPVITLGFLNALAYELQFIGQVYTTATKVAIISNTFPIFVGILSPIFLGEKPNLKQIASIILGILGILLVGNVFSFGGINLGDALSLIASLIYALYVIIAKKFSTREDPIIYTFSTNLISTATAFLFLPISLNFSPDLLSILSIIWLAVFPSTLGYALYFYGLREVGAISSSVIILSTIVFGAILSILILGETLNITESLGLLLVCLGVLLAR